MGGVDAVVEKVQASIDAGDYRWAAQVLDHAVFAAPDRDDVKLLQADCLEQLGYRAESGPWRDFYLTGAQELRHGAPHLGGSLASSVDVLRAMTTEMLVDLMGVRLDGARAESLLLNLTVTDRDDRGVIGLDHGALRFTRGRHDDAATVGLALPHLALARLASGLADLDALADEATVTGDRAGLERLLGTLDTFDASFAIVTP
jgi:alkyl sulfatase BDS1-like metallo-beta-lactamase superfamily hydrolase